MRIHNQQVYLIRGLPGSGKSTLAANLAYAGFIHLEADNYFVNRFGEYNFDPAKLKEAHQLCQSQFIYHLEGGQNIVVSNTFSQMWEMEFYLNECHKRGIIANIVTCDNRLPNVHDVPDSVIAKMKQRWEFL